MKPTVLIVATHRWFPASRLAMALADAGCKVEAVCPPRHPLTKTSVVHHAHLYRGLRPVTSFAQAIVSTKPDLIVPCDDLAIRHLHSLYGRERRRGDVAAHICELIERSLGGSESFPVVCARTAVMELASEEGVRVPKTALVASLDDLRKCADRMCFPIVLKTNGSSSGEGVRIAHTFEEAERAFQSLAAPPLLALAVKRALINQDLTLVWSSLLRKRYVVNAQEYVAGREATSLVACWKGTVLAGLHFEVLDKQDPTGPASVLRLIEDADISSTAEKMVRRLNLSGLHGFDFMLEARTGKPYLIELNPRATQVGHLRLGPGRDLPAALYAAVTRNIIKEAPKTTENETIALFPQEWLRNPASAFLQLGYHDVPWEEPELLRACLRRPRKWSAWYSQRKWIQALSLAPRDRL